MGSPTITVLTILLLFEHGKCDLCDICRRKRDSAVRLPYNQRWYFDASTFLCQPFNFCDDEITERMKGRRSKAEINCGGVDCFEWLYESLKKRQAQESDLPKVMLSHHQYQVHQETTASSASKQPVFTEAARHSEATTTLRSSTVTVRTILKEPATSQDDMLNEAEAPYDFGLSKPEAIHVPLVPKHSPHHKPEVCMLNARPRPSLAVLPALVLRAARERLQDVHLLRSERKQEQLPHQRDLLRAVPRW
ncbi:hypothetical protein MTO96_013049 [Rhipicephalus appendiculatus]